jgi:hypothetical protein
LTPNCICRGEFACDGANACARAELSAPLRSGLHGERVLHAQFQPGPLLAWGNIFYYGNLDTFAEDVTANDQSLEQWFDTSLPFERVAANQPAAFQARVFPRFFDGVRADGLNQWNVNLLRRIRLTRRARLELRGDFINLQNRSQWNPPDLSPTSTNFGRITSQTASLNRFIQVQARLLF